MKIFYIDLTNFSLEKNILLNYAENSKNELHCYGRFLLHNIAKLHYDIENSEVIIVNKKPKFKYSDLQFSISHSKNLVAIAFDENPVGIDVEFMKERDFKAIFARYNIDSEDKQKFYEFWTNYEANIKLQGEAKTKIHTILNNYMITVVGDFQENYQITDASELLKTKEIII